MFSVQLVQLMHPGVLELLMDIPEICITCHYTEDEDSKGEELIFNCKTGYMTGPIRSIGFKETITYINCWIRC